MPAPYNITTAADPFTAGYKLLITALKGSVAFMAASKRFVDWSDGVTTKPLQGLLPNDTPEITIIQGAFTMLPEGRNSRAAFFSQSFTLLAVTDDLQVATANEIKWAALGALHAAQLEQSKWNGNPFVADYNVTNGADTTGGIALPGLASSPARGVDRLCSLIAITLTLYADKSTLPV